MKKLISIVLALFLISSILSGCNKEKDPYAGLKLYENDAGISFYMDKGFEEGNAEGVTCSYAKGKVGLACHTETYKSLEDLGYSNLSETDYANLIMTAYGYNAVPKTDENGLVYVIYEQEIMDIPFTYIAFYLKGETAFWALNFMCPTEDFEKFENDFHLWASSAKIK